MIVAQRENSYRPDNSPDKRLWNPRPNEGHFPGLDLLRVVSATLIFIQHGLSVTDLGQYDTVFGFRIGRLGTAILFVMSGFLAATSSRSPEAWLRRRLVRLYPAFWIVLAASFTAAAITGRKSFDSVQVFCEVAGIGFFTHSWHIVSVTTWFVPVLLAMVILIYCARRLGLTGVFGISMIAIMARAYSVDSYIAEYYGFAFAFLMGYAMAHETGRTSRWVMPIMALGTIAALGLPSFRYALCASVLLALATRSDWPSWRPATAFPPIAYEWFLSHGLCLQFASLFGKNPLFVFTVAALTSIPVAIGIRYLTALAFDQSKRWLLVTVKPISGPLVSVDYKAKNQVIK
jgi:peptidoglycan/LPS O-acetylase OafA/YrhL